MYQTNNYSKIYSSAFLEKGLFDKGMAFQLFNKFLDLCEVLGFIKLCTYMQA